jgi:hypothetical protein
MDKIDGVGIELDDGILKLFKLWEGNVNDKVKQLSLKDRIRRFSRITEKRLKNKLNEFL